MMIQMTRMIVGFAKGTRAVFRRVHASRKGQKVPTVLVDAFCLSALCPGSGLALSRLYRGICLSQHSVRRRFHLSKGKCSSAGFHDDHFVAPVWKEWGLTFIVLSDSSPKHSHYTDLFLQTPFISYTPRRETRTWLMVSKLTWLMWWSKWWRSVRLLWRYTHLLKSSDHSHSIWTNLSDRLLVGTHFFFNSLTPMSLCWYQVSTLILWSGTPWWSEWWRSSD
jgi:hypothetical protein